MPLLLMPALLIMQMMLPPLPMRLMLIMLSVRACLYLSHARSTVSPLTETIVRIHVSTIQQPTSTSFLRSACLVFVYSMMLPKSNLSDNHRFLLHGTARRPIVSGNWLCIYVSLRLVLCPSHSSFRCSILSISLVGCARIRLIETSGSDVELN